MRSVLLLLALSLMTSTAWADDLAVHRIGAGLHYLYNVGELKTSSINSADLSKDSFGLIGSYQYSPGLFRFEGDVEYVVDYIGTGKSLVEPSAWLLVGGGLYLGGGTGIGYTDGGWLDHAWYGLRAGMEIPLSIADIDLFATYRFQEAGKLEDVVHDLDSVTFAAILRFGK